MSRGFSAAKLCRRKLYVGELVFVSPRPQVPVTWGLAYRKGLSPEDPNATATPSRAFLAARDCDLLLCIGSTLSVYPARSRGLEKLPDVC